jgi:hypothetical protein
MSNAALAASFVGRRGLLVEFGPRIVGCHVVEMRTDADGMSARIVLDGGEELDWGGRWEVLVFTAELWQVIYANSRIVFDAEAVRRFDAGEPLDIADYL